MFLPDTRVVSELLRPSPDAGVGTWVGALEATDLSFSAIGEAELRCGVAILPAGGRPPSLPPSMQSCGRTSGIGFSRSTATLPENMRKLRLRGV